MNWPRLTIVTTNRNYGRYLGAAIDSVLTQDYPNLEYLVLDAASTDDSAAVIQRYAPRLAYWHSKADGGPAAGLNAGLRRATGEWFHYLNSDDFLLPGALRRFAAVAAAAGPRLWISGGRHEVDASGNFQRTVLPWRAETHLFPLGRMWHPAEGTFLHLPSLRRLALEFDEAYQNIFDTVLYTKLDRLAPPLYADAYFGAMRLHGANLSGPANSASVARDAARFGRECGRETLGQRLAARLFTSRLVRPTEKILAAGFRRGILGRSPPREAARPRPDGSYEVMPILRALRLPPSPA